jgi:hypothetical protein
VILESFPGTAGADPSSPVNEGECRDEKAAGRAAGEEKIALP